MNPASKWHLNITRTRLISASGIPGCDAKSANARPGARTCRAPEARERTDPPASPINVLLFIFTRYSPPHRFVPVLPVDRHCLDRAYSSPPRSQLGELAVHRTNLLRAML